MQIVERIAEHYEVEQVEFGKVYRWCPEFVVIECECGKQATHKRADLIGSAATTCECGKDDTAGIREELTIEQVEEDYEARHYPWRYWHTTKETGLPF